MPPTPGSCGAAARNRACSNRNPGARALRWWGSQSRPLLRHAAPPRGRLPRFAGDRARLADRRPRPRPRPHSCARRAASEHRSAAPRRLGRTRRSCRASAADPHRRACSATVTSSPTTQSRPPTSSGPRTWSRGCCTTSAGRPGRHRPDSGPHAPVVALRLVFTQLSGRSRCRSNCPPRWAKPRPRRGREPPIAWWPAYRRRQVVGWYIVTHSLRFLKFEVPPVEEYDRLTVCEPALTGNTYGRAVKTSSVPAPFPWTRYLVS
jgi:hypothetical protein